VEAGALLRIGEEEERRIEQGPLRGSSSRLWRFEAAKLSSIQRKSASRTWETTHKFGLMGREVFGVRKLVNIFGYPLTMKVEVNGILPQ